MKKLFVISLFIVGFWNNFLNAQSNDLGCHPRYQTLTSSSHDANYLWGMTDDGGANMDGVIFKYHVSNNTYTHVYSFNGGSGVNGGAHPFGSLYYSSTDSVFYGMTYQGGDSSYGTIFKYKPSTNTYTGLYAFTSTDGTNPNGGFVNIPENGTTVLYGTTSTGAD